MPSRNRRRRLWNAGARGCAGNVVGLSSQISAGGDRVAVGGVEIFSVDVNIELSGVDQEQVSDVIAHGDVVRPKDTHGCGFDGSRRACSSGDVSELGAY